LNDLPPFDRHLFDPSRRLSRLGGGELGGKAQGLRLAAEILSEHEGELKGLGFEFDVPALVALGTDVFDTFLERNDLRELHAEESSDEAIKRAFQHASVPAELAGDLTALATEARVPLAVRSSSLLEDALGQPFAGVYGTKMIPGNQVQTSARVRSLLDAIKFVWASTFFDEARAYRRSVRNAEGGEKMAVLVQEVVGRAHGERFYPRFYPDISGVARSLDFYPQGRSRPEDGIVHLALGLGKTIVDGDLTWSFSPARPAIGPPFGSVRDKMDATQTRFWAVNTGPPPAYDPMTETEYLVRPGLAEAESDGTLRYAASTYDPASDRLVPGTGRVGPRILDFAPLLVHGEIPLAAAVRVLLDLCETTLGAPVEIEFALSLPPGGPRRFGFLQVRPLAVGKERVEVSEEDLAAPGAVVASRRALGNGRLTLSDIVYVDPSTFTPTKTREIAEEIAAVNRGLLDEGRPYLLIGFGRWGSSDPWLGIPVRWDQISGARAIVEAAMPGMSPEPSQGSHFFHNLSSFEVCYLTVPLVGGGRGGDVDWNWLWRHPEHGRTANVRHLRLAAPLKIAVDGRSGYGIVRRQEDA
jgi:hypothetical protein